MSHDWPEFINDHSGLECQASQEAPIRRRKAHQMPLLVQKIQHLLGSSPKVPTGARLKMGTESPCASEMPALRIRRVLQPGRRICRV
jgi:hypothetical protein